MLWDASSLDGSHLAFESQTGGPTSYERMPAGGAGCPALLHDVSHLFPSTCLLFSITALFKLCSGDWLLPYYHCEITNTLFHFRKTFFHKSRDRDF